VTLHLRFVKSHHIIGGILLLLLLHWIRCRWNKRRSRNNWPMMTTMITVVIDYY